MKQTYKIVSTFLCAILVFSSLLTICAADTVVSDTTVSVREKKVYSKATIEQDFADDHVLVVIDNNTVIPFYNS